MYGKKYWGIARTTFIIDAKGRIAKVFEKVKPEEHGEAVAEALAALA
jgi:peroxiredoxin Q/BCP